MTFKGFQKRCGNFNVFVCRCTIRLFISLYIDEVQNSPSHSPVRRRTHEPVQVSSKENVHKKWVKICNIASSEEDKNIILNGEWLND